MRRPLLWCSLAGLIFSVTLCAQQTDQDIIRQLTQRLEDSERRIQALEQKLGMTSPAPAVAVTSASPAVSATQAPQLPPPATSAVSAEAAAGAAQAAAEEAQVTICRSRAADPC